MSEIFSRTELLFGKANVEKLKNSRVAIFGLGGVGGYTAEALARSAVGTLDLIDNDTISESNINRQIYALNSTIGMLKTDAAKQRIHDINPDAAVNVYPVFFMPETADAFDFSQYDYVVDAIDTVSGKLSIIEKAVKAGVPVISAMGAGNKLDPTAFKVADISKTTVCPLARVMRRELKKRGIEHVKVVYSTEQPAERAGEAEQEAEQIPGRRQIPASNAFVPSVAGLIIAGEVVKDITGQVQ